MAKAREGLLLWLLLIVFSVAGAVLLLVGHQPKAERLVAHEDAALALLTSLRDAQGRFHEAQGRYGWFHELAEAGMLPDLRLVQDAAATVSDRVHGEATGYRFDVLLPHQVQGGRLVKVVPRGPIGADDELRKAHVVLVARPLQVGTTGFRIFCTDETKFIWVSEGVSDEAIRVAPPLPDAHLGTSILADTSGHVWHRLDKLVPRGEAEEVRN